MCLETYYRDRNSFLQCKHRKECKYFDNPPNYEGGRAFMPFLNQMNRDQQFWGRPPGLQPRPRQQPLRPGHWPPRPAPNTNNPFRPVPAAEPAQPGDGTQPGPAQPQPQPQDDVDPVQFIMQDFFGPGGNVQFHDNQLRRDEPDNGFLGAAAMFTMEQLMRRAR